jgi:hypothetical protein
MLFVTCGNGEDVLGRPEDALRDEREKVCDAVTELSIESLVASARSRSTLHCSNSCVTNLISWKKHLSVYNLLVSLSTI